MTYALSPALQDIAAERERQMAVEGIMPAHDDGQVHAELPRCAMAYLDYNARRVLGLDRADHVTARDRASIYWPWGDDGFFKPVDLRRNLVKAAALLAAEIERMDRSAPGVPARTVPARTLALVPARATGGDAHAG